MSEDTTSGSKSALQSRTILGNAVVLGAFEIAKAFGYHVTPEMAGAIVGILPLVNILLRLVTHKPIGK